MERCYVKGFLQLPTLINRIVFVNLASTSEPLTSLKKLILLFNPTKEIANDKNRSYPHGAT